MYLDVGAVSGRLTTIAPAQWSKDKVLCRCECGSTKSVVAIDIKRGKTKSCGCLQSESTRKRSLTHGLSYHPLYTTWKNMMERCYVASDPAYPHYGGRGIYVVAEWHSIETFIEDMSPKPQGLSLDRIDNDGPYCKDNCRWATQTEQIRNRRTTHMLTAFGETKSSGEWAEDPRCMVAWDTMSRRIRRGWSVEDAISTPPQPRRVP